MRGWRPRTDTTTDLFPADNAGSPEPVRTAGRVLWAWFASLSCDTLLAISRNALVCVFSEGEASPERAVGPVHASRQSERALRGGSAVASHTRRLPSPHLVRCIELLNVQPSAYVSDRNAHGRRRVCP